MDYGESNHLEASKRWFLVHWNGFEGCYDGDKSFYIIVAFEGCSNIKLEFWISAPDSYTRIKHPITNSKKVAEGTGTAFNTI